MKPLLSETQDNQALQALGKASVQIVHDLKNHINGLKLYATFLRKRMERSERPADELETVNKLMAGLDRTAADLSMIVQFGQPVDLRKQPGIDLQTVVLSVATSLNERSPATDSLNPLMVVDSDPGPLVGEFDSVALADALKWISVGASKLPRKGQDQAVRICVSGEASGSGKTGIIEWRGFGVAEHDPFNTFIGSDGLRMALAAKVVEAHGGSAEALSESLRVRLPLMT